MMKRSWFQMLTLIKGIQYSGVCLSDFTRSVAMFAKSDILKTRFRLCLAEPEISELPEDSNKYLS